MKWSYQKAAWYVQHGCTQTNKDVQPRLESSCGGWRRYDRHKAMKIQMLYFRKHGVRDPIWCCSSCGGWHWDEDLGNDGDETFHFVPKRWP